MSLTLLLISFIYHFFPSSHPVPEEVISGPGHKVLICGQQQFSHSFPPTYPARCLGRASRCFILAWLWLPARPPTPMTPSFPHQLSQRSTEAPFLQAKYSYPVAEHSSGVGVSWEVERVREAQEILFSTKLLWGKEPSLSGCHGDF